MTKQNEEQVQLQCEDCGERWVANVRVTPDRERLITNLDGSCPECGGLGFEVSSDSITPEGAS